MVDLPTQDMSGDVTAQAPVDRVSRPVSTATCWAADSKYRGTTDRTRSIVLKNPGIGFSSKNGFVVTIA